MRSAFRPTLFACLGLVFANARGESTATSDIFLNAYLACGSAEKLEAAGDTAGAIDSYKRAIVLLDQVTQEDATWKPEMVKRRRELASDALARLGGGGKGAPMGKPSAPKGPIEGDLPGRDEVIIPGMDGFVPPKRDSGKKPTTSTNVPPASGDKLLESAQNYLNGLKEDLSNTKDRLSQATRDKEEMARKLEKALKDAAESAEKQMKLEKRANMAENELLKFEKEGGKDSAAADSARAEIAQLRKQMRDLKYERDAEKEIREQLAQSIGNARARVTTANEERDAARRENKEFPAKIAAMQKEIDKVLSEKTGVETKLTKVQETLAKVTSERDEAVTQIAKMKEASKNVDKLMSDNTMLMAKLTDAEATIKTFKAQGEEKDKQIAAMKLEMGTVKQQLADAKKQSETYQVQMTALQTKLDTQAKELTQLKTDVKLSETERKKLAEENETLRGIVVRQMKQQAVREKTKQIVLTELAKLDVSSKALLDQIEFLGQPVVKLTEKEKKLFKQPTIEIGDAEIAISSPKEATAANTPPPMEATPKGPIELPKVPDATKPAVTPDANVAKTPVEGELPTNSADPKMAEANPAPAGKGTEPSTNIPGTSGTTPSPTKSTAGNSAGTTADNMTAPDSGSPAVPPELLSQAREAKDQFDKGNYRDAEKTYERILQKAPNNLYILSNLGVVRFRAQKLKLAEEAFKKAIAIAPEDAFSRCTLGIVYYSEGKYDEAVNELTKALAINPKNATAHNYLGITASQKGWQEAAQKELETAVALDPQYADAHFNLAVVFATQQPPSKEKARKHYQLATTLGAEPDSALEQLIK